MNEKDESGAYKFLEPPTLEFQNAIRVFGSIPHVFELLGTKRFKPGDPLIQLLASMRAGRRIPEPVWTAVKGRFATDNRGAHDRRHSDPEFSEGHGLSIYWEHTEPLDLTASCS